jgi:hypothetical protein
MCGQNLRQQNDGKNQDNGTELGQDHLSSFRYVNNNFI